jgi:putative endonuclease
MAHSYYVYVMANSQRALYIGVTRDLRRRFDQHVRGTGSAFAARCEIHRLIYVEVAGRAIEAIQREKQLKGWTRKRKLALIESVNPDWCDRAAEWGWYCHPERSEGAE